VTVYVASLNTFVCILGEFTPNNSHGLVTSPLNESQQSDGRWPISLQGCYEWRASKLKTAYDPISHKFLREFPEFLKFIDANWINVIDIERINTSTHVHVIKMLRSDVEFLLIGYCLASCRNLSGASNASLTMRTVEIRWLSL